MDSTTATLDRAADPEIKVGIIDNPEIGDTLILAVELNQLPIGSVVIEQATGTAHQLANFNGDAAGRWHAAGTSHGSDAQNLIRNRSFGGRIPKFTVAWIPERTS